MDRQGMTVRQRIVSLLETGPVSPREISQAAGVSEKEIPLHLASIEKSLRRQNRKLVVLPSRCLKCGFRFSKGNRFKQPSRCPKCRESRISPGRFRVDPAKS